MYFVRFFVGRSTFVSKKVFPMNKLSASEAYQKAIDLGAKFQTDSWSPTNQSATAIVVKRPTDEMITALAQYGFEDGCFDVNPEPQPEKSLEEEWQEAVQICEWGMGVKIEKLREFKAAGFDLNVIGYGHIN